MICKEDKQHIVLNATMKIQERLREIEQATKDCKLPDFGIRVKDIQVLQGMIVVPWHPTLIRMLAWFDKEFPNKIMFTSAFREGGGVHGTNPLRGVDLRSHEFTDPIRIRNYCNQEWDYGKEPYRVCVYHDSGRGVHFHLQVRNETKRRIES